MFAGGFSTLNCFGFFDILLQADESHRWLGILTSATTMWSASGHNFVTLDYEISALHNAASIDLFGVQLNYLLEHSIWQNLKEKVLKQIYV